METTCGRTRHHRRRRRSSVHGAGSWRTYAVADPPCWGEWAWRCGAMYRSSPGTISHLRRAVARTRPGPYLFYFCLPVYVLSGFTLFCFIVLRFFLHVYFFDFFYYFMFIFWLIHVPPPIHIQRVYFFCTHKLFFELRSIFWTHENKWMFRSYELSFMPWFFV